MKSYLLKHYEIMAAAVIAFFNPINSLMLLVGLLMLADIITGIWAAKKKGEAISSRKLGATLPKGITYQLAIIVAHLVEVNLYPGLNLAKITAGFIAIAELKSFEENFHVITGVKLGSYVRDVIKKQRGA